MNWRLALGLWLAVAGWCWVSERDFQEAVAQAPIQPGDNK